jgi:5-hydroxyisourate hydrolase
MAEAENRLTVHVLDTARGRPAAGMALTLSRAGALLAERVTNDDGRCDAPLLTGAALAAGTYEIAFDIAAWRSGLGESDGGFYDRIAIRFMVGENAGHVHIPLLLSPYGYSTYRGS